MCANKEVQGEKKRGARGNTSKIYMACGCLHCSLFTALLKRFSIFAILRTSSERAHLRHLHIASNAAALACPLILKPTDPSSILLNTLFSPTPYP